MKKFIKQRLNENLNMISEFDENIIISDINDIDDDELYDTLMQQSEELREERGLSFNADLFQVGFTNNALLGGTWIENNPSVFSPHIIIKEGVNSMVFIKLLNGLIQKYLKMKELRGEEYQFIANIVNDKLARIIGRYGFIPYGDQENTFIYQPN